LGRYIHSAFKRSDRLDAGAFKNCCAIVAGHPNVRRVSFGGIGTTGVGLPQGIYFLVKSELRETPHHFIPAKTRISNTVSGYFF
jgi:hypothetical protein